MQVTLSLTSKRGRIWKNIDGEAYLKEGSAGQRYTGSERVSLPWAGLKVEGGRIHVAWWRGMKLTFKIALENLIFSSDLLFHLLNLFILP